MDFADYIFSSDYKGGGLLTLEQLIETMLELGGTNAASVKDIIDARKVATPPKVHGNKGPACPGSYKIPDSTPKSSIELLFRKVRAQPLQIQVS